MLKYPEACLLSGVWLLVSNFVVFGYTLIALSIFLSFARFAIQLQKEKEREKIVSECLTSLTQTLQGAMVGFGLKKRAGRYDEVSH